MKAAIISIGDEILIGQVQDTNSGFIARELNKIGFAISRITSIRDEKEAIVRALEEACGHAQLVILSGGLGPTRDDVTRSSLCEFFEDELREDPQVLSHLKTLLEKSIEGPLSELNKRQALVPGKAELLTNHFGTAPGLLFRKGEVTCIALPGVPFELQELMTREVIPRLQRQFARPVILHKTVITYGVAESVVAERLSDWEDQLPEYIRLAYLPDFGKVRLRITASGENQEHLQNSIDSLLTDLHQLIGDIIVGYDDEEPAAIQIARLLSTAKKTLSTAESCTGGRLAGIFSTPAGASVFFRGSLVCYATGIKKDILKVPEDLLETYSVVSAEVAEAMAENARSLFKSDYAISTTGNAGPAKGDSDAELGTVFIGIATPSGVYSRKFIFGNHREKVISKAVDKSIELMLSELIQHSASGGQ